VSLDGICTGADEYLPLISPDNELIFYTRRYMTVDKRTTIQKEAEEFTFSNRLWNKGDEVYSSGIPMPYPFNTSSNQGGATITALNNHMFFTRCDYIIINETNYNNCDIYKSDYIDGKWTNPQKLGSNINGKDTWESQPSVSADGKTLYFASARPAGVGGIDIYSSELNEHGEWEKARNLGKTINTEGDDKSPFIHSDSKTLYFSSNGRPGLGGFDIFYSKQTGKNEWTEPVNIGYPINTEEDDLGFIVSTDGKKAYFSSNKLNGKGGLDIYSIDLYEAARPQKMMLLKGQLTDYKGHGLTNAVVEVKSVKSDSLSEGIVDKLTGKYAVILPVRPKEEFVMTVRKKQYTFSSQLLVSEEEDGEKPREINVGLSPVEAGVSFQISNILFATNSADFDNASLIILENLKRFLSENPKVRLAIYGHTDNVGDEQSNIILSEKRAGAVLDFLREHGIDNKRLISKGFGELIPIAGNDTEEGRALNRRTEFVILEN
jgi:outer membrane protein OmpA-like peptidoglycan-associated protein